MIDFEISVSTYHGDTIDEGVVESVHNFAFCTHYIVINRNVIIETTRGVQ